jgi:hypothetical protein
MPSLTMQSIGVAGTQLATAQQAGYTARSSEAGAQAGLQRNQNQLRAIASATEVKPDKKRSIQTDKRPEGTFSEGEENNEQQPDVPRKTPGSFDRIA